MGVITIELSRNIIKKYVEVTTPVEITSKDKTVYGTISGEGDELYVKLDGSDVLTPISSTIDVRDGDRVLVLIKNHEAMVLGSPTSPTARLEELRGMGDQITEFGVIIADKVGVGELVAMQALIDELQATDVEISGKLEANEASIETLTAENATINGKLTAYQADIEELQAKKIDADEVEAKYATIESLEATDLKVTNLDAAYGAFETLTASKLEALEAEIENLDVENLDAKYVNIDFANVDSAWFDEFYAKSGMIENVTISEGVVVKELVGVTIKGDLIEGGTIKADKLVVLGTDGLYYKLNLEAGVVETEEVPKEQLQNGLHGTAIIAKTITAEKISVDDLVAFGATIGGFKISDTSIYSGVKESATNSTMGVYLDSDGQFAVGDSNNFIKFYKDETGNYRLDISAVESIKIGGRNLIRNSTNLIYPDYGFHEAGGDTLTWDGDTEGLDNIMGMYFKISDSVVMPTDLANGVAFVFGGIRVENTLEELVGNFGAVLEDGLVVGDYLIFVPYDNYDLTPLGAEGVTCQKGVYFYFYAEANAFVSELQIPGFTGFGASCSNSLDAHVATSPLNKDEECAMLVVDDVANSFTMSDITTPGKTYTFAFWIKSDAAGGLRAADTEFASNTEWVKHSVTFDASGTDFDLEFTATGTYYIYCPMLEFGNKATDWTPAPEDLATEEDVENVKSMLLDTSETIANLSVAADNISAEVTRIETTAQESINALGENVSTLTEQVAAKVSADEVSITVKEALENGTGKVVTSTGYTFDEEGMTVQKSGSEMKTQITEDGMTVYKNEEAVLTANNTGVDAVNLHASTYLIVGENSRFEDYGENRTGCFWIGGGE